MVCFHQHRINDSTVLSSSDSRKNKSIAVAVVGSITVYILAWSESRFIQGIAKLRKMCSQVLVISVLYCLFVVIHGHVLAINSFIHLSLNWKFFFAELLARVICGAALVYMYIFADNQFWIGSVWFDLLKVSLARLCIGLAWLCIGSVRLCLLRVSLSWYHVFCIYAYMYIESVSMDLLHVHQLILAWLVYGMGQLRCSSSCGVLNSKIYIFRSLFGSSVQY